MKTRVLAASSSRPPCSPRERGDTLVWKEIEGLTCRATVFGSGDMFVHKEVSRRKPKSFYVLVSETCKGQIFVANLLLLGVRIWKDRDSRQQKHPVVWTCAGSVPVISRKHSAGEAGGGAEPCVGGTEMMPSASASG